MLVRGTSADHSRWQPDSVVNADDLVMPQEKMLVKVVLKRPVNGSGSQHGDRLGDLTLFCTLH